MTDDVVMTLIDRLVAAEARIAALERQELPRAISSDTYNDSVARILGTDTDGTARLDGLEVGNVTGVGVGGIYIAGNHDYQGDLKPYRNATTYVGYVFVPLATPATSTAWDGDAKADNTDGVIDLSAVFGVPAGIKAISFSLFVKSDTVGRSGTISTSAGVYGVSVYANVANQYECGGGVVPCDANGDVYWLAGGALDGVILNILGYYF